MEHYNVPEWQPYLIAAALGAGLIALGIAALITQLVVSVRSRHERLDLTGDPWDGRTLEWLTSSPPAPYNFAIVPHVRESDPFHEMKRRGVAYQRSARYTDIVMPRNTGAGVIIGGLAFALGFAMVWHIWWLALASGLGILITVAIRASNDDTEFVLPAAEVQAIEDQRRQVLAAAPTHVDEHTPVRDAALVRGVT
jgi:cytochrome o ubiquinol oxidase subunit 1